MTSIYLDKDNKRYLLGAPFSYGDINYTVEGATAETFAALGFREVAVQPKPDNRFYAVNSYPNSDGSWDAKPHDHGELVYRWVDQVKKAAGSLLQPTDWKIIREVEGGKPADAELKAWRKAVRDESDVKVTAIEGTTTVEALIAVVTAAGFLEFTQPN